MLDKIQKDPPFIHRRCGRELQQSVFHIIMSDDNWPVEVEEAYERVRVLGQGAFGSVWLAKSKHFARLSSTENTNNEDDVSIEDDQFDIHLPINKAQQHAFVAIKRIHAVDSSEIQYASREIDILSELQHPNIIQCLGHFTLNDCRLVILTLADGPNLQQLVDHGGALSISLARLASRHLIAAVSYLHGRGVMHRDIKPDNLILMKNNRERVEVINQEEWREADIFWDDKVTFDENEWKVVLVDFGFAKALSKKEMEGKQPSLRQLFDKQASHHGLNKQNLIEPTRPILNKRFSFERKPIRAMSAVGTRAYAAPEVMKVRKKSPHDEALTNCVSDYGFISDSYSVGSTIKVLLTGVPADVTDVMGFMSANSNPLLYILSAIFTCSKKNKRRKRYKFLDETPKKARELIEKLMRTKADERLALPLAKNEQWIKGGCCADDPLVNLPEGDIVIGINDPVLCLRCSVHT